MSRMRPIDGVGRLSPRLRVALAEEGIPHVGVSVRLRLVAELLGVACVQAPSGWIRSWLRPDSGEAERAALVALARCWLWLPRGAKEAWVGLAGAVAPGVLDEASRDDRWWARAGAAMAIAEGRCFAACGALLELTSDEDERVAEAAERALWRLAAHAEAWPAGAGAGSGRISARVGRVVRRSRRPLEGETRALHAALYACIDGFERHRRRGPFVAAAACLSPAWWWGAPRSALGEWVRDGDSATHLVTRSVVKRSPEPVLGARAVEWLVFSHLAGACLDRLSGRAGPEERGLVFARSHLLLHPGRARRLGLVERAELPSAEETRALPVEALRGTPRWVSSLSLRRGSPEGALRGILGSGDVHARLALVACGPRSVLASLCFDEDSRVATSAALRWSSVGARRGGAEHRRADLRHAMQLKRHAHGAVRRIGAREVERLDPWAGGAASVGIARLALHDDRTGTLERIQAGLRDGSTPARLSAIRLARALRVEGEVELDLLAAAAEQHGDFGNDSEGARVVSAVASALGGAASASSREALLRLSGHTHPRVRANALEALARLARRGAAQREASERGGETQSLLHEFKGDGHHRVRGAAIRWLLDGSAASGVTREAVRGLTAMLEDDRWEHRRAGLWAAQRVARGRGPRPSSPASVVSRVRLVASGDPEALLRRRARHVLHSLGYEREGTGLGV